ncbi:MAG: FAD-dependent monooxygenase [Clostridia bacterium]|nr:FAD-dependent monooxygenase [Clostridia bacterium]
MSTEKRTFIVNNIKLSVNASYKEAFSVARRRLSRLGIKSAGLSFSIYRRSVDARRKSDVSFVYSVAVTGELPSPSRERLMEADVALLPPVSLSTVMLGEEKMSAPPLIVGSGPCGLFAALLLAENGYAPILIERGGSVKERQGSVSRFNTAQILDPDTNIQFGAGGAGTFSDGKLITRINDPISSYVLSRLVEFGAPKEILYLAKPHVGTDVLAPVITKIIERIEELGGKVLFHTKYINHTERPNGNIAITSRGEIPCSAIILAIGHSARDTYDGLIYGGYSIEAKPFSVGMRIEHLAESIDKALYGDFAGHSALGHAEYNLSHNTKVRGVYTFCMCPGGEVVAAASEIGGVVVNGMSAHARDGKNSNSAVVCSIFKEDYGQTPRAAIDFQRKIERAAFYAGGGDYSAPISSVGDFLSSTGVHGSRKVTPTYMGGIHVKEARPEEFLPDFVCTAIRNALYDFDKKIPGFSSPDAILTGAETRTSAPIRILRDPETRLAIGTRNLYPAGEGAGYAGGITSAAIDGIKTAFAVMKRYKPL